jgi:hypothetical protein
MYYVMSHLCCGNCLLIKSYDSTNRRKVCTILAYRVLIIYKHVYMFNVTCSFQERQCGTILYIHFHTIISIFLILLRRPSVRILSI